MCYLPIEPSLGTKLRYDVAFESSSFLTEFLDLLIQRPDARNGERRSPGGRGEY